MYVRKIMVCNVTNFSYNRGPPGGGLYCGSIGSIKDRCVIGTCEKKKISVPSLDTRLAPEMPAGHSVGVFHEDQRSKYSETADYGSTENFPPYGPGSVAKCLQQPVFPGGHPSKY